MIIWINIKIIFKKICSFSKNIIKKPINKWILIILSIKLKIIILLQSVMLENNKLIKRKEFFISLLTLLNRPSSTWINCKNKTLIKPKCSNHLWTVKNNHNQFPSFNTRGINKKWKKVDLKYSESNNLNQLFGKLDNPLIKLEKCLIFKK